MASVFLSHSSRDKVFALRLAEGLRRRAHRVWLDQWVIRAGESIPSKVSKGLDDHSFLAVALTPHSVKSRWVTNEWEAKYAEEIKRKHVMVLPLLVERCTIPTLLRSRRYVDFTADYVDGFVELLQLLKDPTAAHGICGYSPNVVQEMDAFKELIARSRTADLLLMYGSTWRGTWRDALGRMLQKRGARLRIILPAVDRDLELRRLYARRLGYSGADVLHRFRTAIREFSQISRRGITEIYTTRSYLNQALYLFDHGMVMSLYSYRGRERTPAVITQDGDLQKWARADFEGLLHSRALLTKRVWPRPR